MMMMMLLLINKMNRLAEIQTGQSLRAVSDFYIQRRQRIDKTDEVKEFWISLPLFLLKRQNLLSTASSSCFQTMVRLMKGDLLLSITIWLLKKKRKKKRKNVAVAAVDDFEHNP